MAKQPWGSVQLEPNHQRPFRRPCKSSLSREHSGGLHVFHCTKAPPLSPVPQFTRTANISPLPIMQYFPSAPEQPLFSKLACAGVERTRVPSQSGCSNRETGAGDDAVQTRTRNAASSSAAQAPGTTVQHDL